jgi:hypothetical protein
MVNKSGILEKANKAIADPDHTLGEKAPGTPFVLVALSYLAVLAIVCAVTALFIWLG